MSQAFWRPNQPIQMSKSGKQSPPRTAGYSRLLERFSLGAIPHWHRSFVSSSAQVHRIETIDGITEETYKSAYWPGETVAAHLEFALKYDGTNLAILAAVFERMPLENSDTAELVEYITANPSGKYARRLWFFYEWLTGNRLPLEDLPARGSYTQLLDPTEYYTLPRGEQLRRYRIENNLLGEAAFCPMVRRTPALAAFEAADLTSQCEQVIKRYSPDLLRRALSYLYTKETKSSFAIERITPDSRRAARFIALLHSAESEDYCNKQQLILLQNQIVDERFRESDYRSSQNYIGQNVNWQEKVHYVCPAPQFVHDLMSGLIASHGRMTAGQIPPVVHAAAIAYGFVFIHPFEDGNGRIHRFLIHDILSQRGFTPPRMVFPVSAVFLSRPADYDRSLEAFSRPLMQHVDYELDPQGQMLVHNADELAKWYRYGDFTTQVEALFAFIQETITSELVHELDLLASYDRSRAAIQQIVDMPDRKLDALINCIRDNHGRLSKAKRDGLFDFLTDDEVARIEAALSEATSNDASSS